VNLLFTVSPHVVDSRRSRQVFLLRLRRLSNAAAVKSTRREECLHSLYTQCCLSHRTVRSFTSERLLSAISPSSGNHAAYLKMPYMAHVSVKVRTERQKLNEMKTAWFGFYFIFFSLVHLCRSVRTFTLRPFTAVISRAHQLGAIVDTGVH